MTDPLKLAEEIEGMDEFGSRAADRRLLAAALRLAELTLRVEDETAGVGGSEIENAQYDAVNAYRAAREGT